MPPRVPVDRDFVLDGVVTDRATHRGARGVRVEVWDHETRDRDLLGHAMTDDDGLFVIGFDSRDAAGGRVDRAREVYFRVFQDAAELLSTFDRPQTVARGTTRIRLDVDLPQLPSLGRDRVTAQQAFKAIDWWRASDFRGVARESRDKGTTVGKLAAAVVGHSIKTFDFKPITPKGASEREIVERDQDSARRHLAGQQVEVTTVKPMSDLPPGARAKLLTSYPARLRPGDRVTLYEENGVVKYYTRDPVASETADAATISRIDNDVQTVKARLHDVDTLRTDIADARTTNAEIAVRVEAESTASRANTEELTRVRRELEEVRQASARKDIEIAKLNNDLVQLRGAQADLATRVSVDRINALERAVERLSRERVPVVPIDRPIEPPVIDRPHREGRPIVPGAAPAKAPKSRKKQSPRKRKGGG